MSLKTGTYLDFSVKQTLIYFTTVKFFTVLDSKKTYYYFTDF